VCADGGIDTSGDMAVALAVGASSVMLGRLLASSLEAPGEIREVGGHQVKAYFGMGSARAMRESAASRARYGQEGLAKFVPEGVESTVPYSATTVREMLENFSGGIKSGFGYVGVTNIPGLQANARIIRMTEAGLAESRPHHITVVSEGRSS